MHKHMEPLTVFSNKAVTVNDYLPCLKSLLSEALHVLGQLLACVLAGSQLLTAWRLPVTLNTRRSYQQLDDLLDIGYSLQERHERKDR
jgi:hypothetical protein